MRVPTPLFSRSSWLETSRVAGVLRRETVGGLVLLVAAAVAMVWANTPWASSYDALKHLHVAGLSLETWAADGLLAVFFFIVGVELKQEFLAGDLRDPRRAALPVAAAIGGMIVPAVIYLVLMGAAGAGHLQGWAIPTATDIAFALAVLAVIGTHLPSALRTFLLTLAVVDDLLGVTVIAVFYTKHLELAWFALALVVLAVSTWLMHRDWFWPLVILAPATWYLVHESGVHATIAGVLLGFCVPLVSAPKVEHLVRPVSAGVCVPLFAFFVAGLPFADMVNAVRDPLPWAILIAFVVGKPLGILATSWLLARFTKASLDPSITWADVLGVAIIAGIGFTVSLLIADLALGQAEFERAKAGIVGASLLSAAMAAIVLKRRDEHYRQVEELEGIDADGDDIPDVFE